MERDQDHSPLWRDWDDGRPNSHGLVSEWSILPFSSRLALFCAILLRMVTHYIALNQNLLCFSVILITFILIYLISVIYLFIKSILPPPAPAPLISPSLTAMIYLGYQRVKLFKSEAVKITISQLWSYAYRKFSGGSPRKMEKGHHPDSDLSVIHHMGLFCPRKKLVKVKKLYFQDILKYAPPPWKVIGEFQVLS